MKRFERTHDGEAVGVFPGDERWSAHRVGKGRWEWWSEQTTVTMPLDEAAAWEEAWWFSQATGQ